MSTAPAGAAEALDALLAARATATERFFPPQSQRIAGLCQAMAERFARGGRLIAFGDDAVARSDVAHVAVEFVHPVIVGKRALPALGIDPRDARLLVRADDVAIAFGGGPAVAAAVATAESAGALTIGFAADGGAQWTFKVPSDDPFVAQELVETLYHVLWELVHVFFEQRGLLQGRSAGSLHDSGASSFLYPFLAESQHDVGEVLADVGASAVAKARETAALREQTVREGAPALGAVAPALRELLDAGGKLLAAGNGGSATDAMDAVADLRSPPAGKGLPQRAALDLTADASILTAIANDIGTEAIFARQVIAYGAPGDALLTFSTSGGSANVIAALAEARRRGLMTLAFVGYGGGRIADDGLADHVVITRSEHIPRIQEAQATAWHVLRELIERPR